MEADPGVTVEILEKRGEDGMEVVGENAREKGTQDRHPPERRLGRGSG